MAKECHTPSPHIGKRVRLHCESNRTFEGFVYTVDPVSGNYVIFPSLDSPDCPIVVSGEMVSRVEEVESDLSSETIIDRFKQLDVRFAPNELTNHSPLDGTNSEPLSAEQLEQRRLKVIQLFESHRINLTDENGGILSVNKVVFIAPPYTVNHCTGSNLVVLNRVKKVLENSDL